MKDLIKRLSPVAGGVLALLLQVLIKNHRRHPDSNYPYFTYLLIVLLGIIIIAEIFSFFLKKTKSFLEINGLVISGGFILVSVLNILTAKTATLPVMLFPSFDNILSVFVESRALMVKCIFHSVKLLGSGVLWGVGIGFLTGVGLGFSRQLTVEL